MVKSGSMRGPAGTDGEASATTAGLSSVSGPPLSLQGAVTTLEAEQSRNSAMEQPPIDIERVAAIRVALASGSYQIDAERIAAAMIAHDLPEQE
ncbi:MAG: flagellar biosynthesis anti-sigma factor FlgM [Sphingomonadaceae bacterium]